MNLGIGRGYSVLEVINPFEKASGGRVNYTIVDRRAGDVAECWALPAKAEQLLGWRARKTLDDMCQDAWRGEKSLWATGYAARRTPVKLSPPSIL